MTNEIKKYVVVFALSFACFLGGFCSGYYYQSGRLASLQTRLEAAEEQQRETARNIEQAETGIDNAKETTGRIEDGVDESRRIEQSTTEILDRIQERIEKVEAENSKR